MVGRPEFPDAALPGANQCGEPANKKYGGCSEDLRAMRQRIDINSLPVFYLRRQRGIAERLVAPEKLVCSGRWIGIAQVDGVDFGE